MAKRVRRWTEPTKRKWTAQPIHVRGPRVKRIVLPENLPYLGPHTSKIESLFAVELQRRSIPFRTQLAVNGGREQAGGAVIDFDLYTMNTLVRIQGDYWHTLPGAEAKDDLQRLTLTAQGYRVVDVWEHDVRTRMNWVFETQIGGIGL